MTTPSTTSGGKPIDPAVLQAMAEAAGYTLDQLADHFSSSEPTTLTVAEHAEGFLKRLGQNTRRTYATAINRFVNGFGPVCDTTCEPCSDTRYDYQCRCDCGRCRNSRIALPDIRPSVEDQTRLQARWPVASRTGCRAASWAR